MKNISENKYDNINNPKVIRKNELMCISNSHTLKLIGGSMNGRSDGKYASVYICKKCNRMGYIEDFVDADVEID
jgi:hypothetical protein